MRDHDGVERGRCVRCAAADGECCEFIYSVWADDDDDSDEDLDAPGMLEAYQADPMLPCLRRRLSRSCPSRKPTMSTACECCHCTSEQHEVVIVEASKQRILEVARPLFSTFDLSIGIRQSVRDTSALRMSREGFTYGEVGDLSFLSVLDMVAEIQATNGQRKGGVFYDLGCGMGKAVILASLHPIGFDRCVGIELLPGLASAASSLGHQLAAACLPGAAPVDFYEGDMLKASLFGASLVLLNAGGWQEILATRFRQRLVQELPVGCILLTIRKSLVKAGDTEFRHVAELRLPMSWGEAPVFLAERLGPKPVAVDFFAMD